MSVVAAVLAAALAVALWLWRRAEDRSRMLAAQLGEAERVLQGKIEEAERLVAGLGGASEGLVVLDGDGRIVATNPAAQELASLPPAEWAGRRVEELIAWPQLPQALELCRRRGEARTFEVDAAHGNGRTLAVRVRALPGRGVVVGIDDESRLRRLESLRRDFVANVSHELKTPLAAIQGFVETLLDDPDMPVPTRQRFLEKIARQTDRLATLVADLLTLSRLDEHGGAEHGEVCEFGGVLRETLRDLLPLAEKCGLELVGEIEDIGVWVRSEREALRQVAGNLVDNAIKYTPGGGRVTVRLATENGRCRLTVVDTGIGLSPADQERVFERFYRVDRARSRELGGTGLGLSIVKNTVLNLGGEVGVHSTLGQGSTFWVELPLAAAQDELTETVE